MAEYLVYISGIHGAIYPSLFSKYLYATRFFVEGVALGSIPSEI